MHILRTAPFPKLQYALVPFALLVSLPVLAHEPTTSGGSLGWNAEPWLLAMISLALILFFPGWHHAIRRARHGRRVLLRQALAFVGALFVLCVALVSPLDALSAQLVSAHMVQHLLLITIAAPLFVLARPLPLFLWSLPHAFRRTVAARSNKPPLLKAWRFLTDPLVAWLLHGVLLWAWHMPALYQAALRESWLHDVEHASFLANALLFWWVVLRAVRRSGTDNAIALALIFTTFLHSGLLAALMAFARSPWYPVYAETVRRWGMSALEDQQLAGLIMWFPAGVTYLVAGVCVLALWLRRMDSDHNNLQPDS